MTDRRPIYHFTNPTGEDSEPFDPNGAIFWKGRYHLGFIQGDLNTCHVHFWWGHVSSEDLIHWRVHPPMLSPSPGDPDQGAFSGNAFADKDGRVVIHYYGVNAGNCIAINDGDDELDSFVKLAANPVMKDPGYDPHGWLEGDTYYSISGSLPPLGESAARAFRFNTPALYRCTGEDQVEWELVGDLLSHEMPDVEADEDVSCPDLFRLGDRHVLLCISHKRGTRYYLGTFEDEQFRPEAHFRMNWPGGTCFAPETLLDDRGRRILWAWVVGSPSTMTVPRVLSMGEDGTLRIEPVEELDSLRRNHRHLGPITVGPGRDLDLEGVSGDCMELRLAIDPGRADRCGVRLRCAPDGSEQTAVLYDAREKVVRIDMARSSLDPGAMPKEFLGTEFGNRDVGAQEAPFELGPGEALDLRIYLDRSIMEVFANGRQCLAQRIYPLREDSLGVRLFGVGEAARFTAVDAWDMGPIVVG